MKYSLLALSLILVTSTLSAEEGFTPIFNGKDLTGWTSIRDATQKGSGSFQVNQADQALHIYQGEKAGSEQPIDCLYSDKEYSHYILKLEYRWLEKRFEPRLHHDRDAGILFHLHGNLEKIWPNCVEMQLGESDVNKVKDRYTTGDLWVIGKDITVMNARNEDHFYSPGASLVPVGKGVSYDKSFIPEGNEHAFGEWNEVTITVHGGKEAIYELNGKVVNRISDLTYVVDGKRVPLDKGRIGLQAEYAELQYRSIRIKELPVPTE